MPNRRARWAQGGIFLVVMDKIEKKNRDPQSRSGIKKIDISCLSQLEEEIIGESQTSLTVFFNIYYHVIHFDRIN